MSSAFTEVRIVRSLTEVFAKPVRGSGNNEIQSETPGKLRRIVTQAGCSYETIRRNVVIGFAVGGIIALSGWTLISLIVFIGILLFTYLYISRKISTRFSEVDRDLPALLTFLASSVRAGLDPLVALIDAQNYLPQGTVLREEVAKCAARVKAGEAEEGCIRSLCDGIPHPDLPLLRSCLLISRRHGTSIAEPLHRVTKVVRQRQSFRRKVRGALVMHRMSAMGIAICAILIALMQVVTNYSALMSAIRHPVGSKVLLAGGTLILTGVCWMMSMGQKEGR